MFVLERKVEEGKILDAINPDVKFPNSIFATPNDPNLRLYHQTPYQRNLQINSDNLTLKGYFKPPTNSWTEFWIKDLKTTTYLQRQTSNHVTTREILETIPTEIKDEPESVTKLS